MGFDIFPWQPLVASKKCLHEDLPNGCQVGEQSPRQEWDTTSPFWEMLHYQQPQDDTEHNGVYNNTEYESNSEEMHSKWKCSRNTECHM